MIIKKLKKILNKRGEVVISNVKSIYENQYIISDNSVQHLLELGFKYDNEENIYVYNFNVLRHEKTTVLRGKITAFTSSSNIHIDVIDNNYIPYAPFYNIECGNYDVILNKINKAILNEFSKLNITKKNRKRDVMNEN